MEYRRLGKSGLKLSALSFGSWVTFKAQVNVADAKQMMGMAYERGINFFDNAEVYAGGASEVIMGQALKELEWTRDTYCVSSKVFWGGQKPTQRGLHRKHIYDACHAALKRLQVDYLDLYFCHRPDIETPIEETVLAMNDLIRQGKVMYWGTSEWTAQQLTEAFEVAGRFQCVGPTMEQPQYNLLHRDKVESEFAPIYERYGLGTTIWSPLASGKLTGKYNKGIPADSRAQLKSMEWLKEQIQSEEGQKEIATIDKFVTLAKDLGMTPAQLGIGWCLTNPHVSTVILGASKPEQLKENLSAIDMLPKINHNVEEALDAIFKNKPKAPINYLTW